MKRREEQWRKWQFGIWSSEKEAAGEEPLVLGKSLAGYLYVPLICADLTDSVLPNENGPDAWVGLRKGLNVDGINFILNVHRHNNVVLISRLCMFT